MSTALQDIEAVYELGRSLARGGWELVIEVDREVRITAWRDTRVVKVEASTMAQAIANLRVAGECVGLSVPRGGQP